jgi:MOSC domain-containing protein YiiM
MRLISVNVGMPREIGTHRGNIVMSAIFKEPMAGPVFVRTRNLEGDKQADPAVHGGEDKAVYAYPSEHYDFWREKFPSMSLKWGAFGENLTTEGLAESQVRVGDRLSIGTAELIVTEPRLPCYKLGIKFGTQKILREFLDSEYSGFYLRVLHEGRVEAGDEIVLAKANGEFPTIASIVRGVKRGNGSSEE